VTSLGCQQARHSDRPVSRQLQRSGRSKREAIEEAASVRLRPILMTTAAMVLRRRAARHCFRCRRRGRHDMGLVIFAGLSIGTLFTLFVVPVCTC